MNLDTDSMSMSSGNINVTVNQQSSGKNSMKRQIISKLANNAVQDPTMCDLNIDMSILGHDLFEPVNGDLRKRTPTALGGAKKKGRQTRSGSNKSELLMMVQTHQHKDFKN